MSSLQVDNIQTYNSNPPVIKNVNGTEVGTFCRAWVNFNGTGTVAIRQSFNVSSITDNGTGSYTVTFTTAMTDANYGIAGLSGRDAAGVGFIYGILAVPTTTAIQIGTCNSTGTPLDVDRVCIAIFR